MSLIFKMEYFLFLVLIMSSFGLFAQSHDNLYNRSQGVNQMQYFSETVPDAFFPFGQPLKLVKQQDRTPKKVFVLGVYASAVHADWYSADGKRLCQALAVASEPEIFWKGDNAADIIKKIDIPNGAGELRVAEGRYNGPSGRTLDELYLTPLGFSRSDAWLCDLIPHSFMNTKQKNAIETNFNKICEEYGLKTASIPEEPSNITIDENRLNELLAELEESQAEIIILLGDYPLECFLSKVSDCKITKLRNFGKNPNDYGKVYKILIKGKQYTVLPLVHVHHSGKEGNYDQEWERLHSNWVQSRRAH